MVASQRYDLAIDTNLGGNNTSDYVIPSQKAVKTYVDSLGVGDLSGVSLSNLSSGQVLGYNGTNWVNTNQTSVTIRDWSVS